MAKTILNFHFDFLNPSLRAKPGLYFLAETKYGDGHKRMDQCTMNKTTRRRIPTKTTTKQLIFQRKLILSNYIRYRRQ